MERRWIKGLNGLRAIAVGLVVFNHKLPLGWEIKPGGYGVHLFFVLSGFLIVGILYGRREKIDEGAASFRVELAHFYENRLFRIWPIYFLTVIGVATAGLMGLREMIPMQQFISLISFTTNLLQAYVWPNWPKQLGAMWSIAVEEQFYLLAAPMFLLLPRRLFAVVLVGIVALAIACGVAQAGMTQFSRANYVGPMTNFGLMAVGGFAAVSMRRAQWHVMLSPALLAVYLALPLLAWKIHPEGLLGATFFWGSGVLIAIVLLGITADQGSWLVRALEISPVRYVGKISYGIYIYHELIDLAAVRGLKQHLPGQTATGLLEIVLALLIASVSWHLIELPLLNLRDRWRLRRSEMIALSRAPALAD